RPRSLRRGDAGAGAEHRRDRRRLHLDQPDHHGRAAARPRARRGFRMTLMERLIEAAIGASDAILEVYKAGAAASWKADGSPVTEADARAEEIIIERLSPLGLPFLAEESVAAGHVPDLGARFFVVDPLDGTKEFLKR